MNANDSSMAANAVAHAAQMAGAEIQYAAASYTAPHVMMRPKISIDGDQWCALYGENLQDGVCGFGKSPSHAMADFDVNWRKELPLPPQANPGAAS